MRNPNLSRNPSSSAVASKMETGAPGVSTTAEAAGRVMGGLLNKFYNILPSFSVEDAASAQRKKTDVAVSTVTEGPGMVALSKEIKYVLSSIQGGIYPKFKTLDTLQKGLTSLILKLQQEWPSHPPYITFKTSPIIGEIHDHLRHFLDCYAKLNKHLYVINNELIEVYNSAAQNQELYSKIGEITASLQNVLIQYSVKEQGPSDAIKKWAGDFYNHIMFCNATVSRGEVLSLMRVIPSPGELVLTNDEYFSRIPWPAESAESRMIIQQVVKYIMELSTVPINDLLKKLPSYIEENLQRTKLELIDIESLKDQRDITKIMHAVLISSALKSGDLELRYPTLWSVSVGASTSSSDRFKMQAEASAGIQTVKSSSGSAGLLLMGAAYKGDSKTVEYILEEDPALIMAYDGLALPAAAAGGHLNIVKTLLRLKADIHAWDDLALLSAVKGGSKKHKKVIEKLLQYGANPVAVDDETIAKLVSKGEEKLAQDLQARKLAIHSGQKIVVDYRNLQEDSTDEEDPPTYTGSEHTNSEERTTGARDYGSWRGARSRIFDEFSKAFDEISQAPEWERDDDASSVSRDFSLPSTRSEDRSAAAAAAVSPATSAIPPTRPVSAYPSSTAAVKVPASSPRSEDRSAAAVLKPKEIEGIFKAAKTGNIKVLQKYIKQGREVNLENNDKETLLVIAVRERHKEIVELLLKHNAEVNLEGKRTSNPLHIAAEKGDKEIVELLLKHNAEIHAVRDGLTPLYVAARAGHKEVVEVLLHHNAQVNQGFKSTTVYMTPLYVAVREGHKEIVELLLKHNAEVNPVDRQRSDSPLHKAVERGDKELVELLLKHKAQINANDMYGATPLFLAARAMNKTMVELLLKFGADVNQVARVGRPPLFWPVTLGCKEVVEILINAGAKVSDGELQASTTTEIHKLLTEAKAKQDEFTKKTSSVFEAIERGDIAIIRDLIAKGWDVKQDNSRIPLHLAAERGHLEIVNLLLEKGADINAPDKNGLTPLCVAALNRNSEIVNLLLKKGAQVSDKALQVTTTTEILKRLTKEKAKQEATAEEAIADDTSDTSSSSVQEKAISPIASSLPSSSDAAKTSAHGSHSEDRSAAAAAIYTASPTSVLSASSEELIEAVKAGNQLAVKALLVKGENVNTIEEQGKSLLYLAAEFNKLQVFKLLLEAGAKPDVKSQVGRTPLFPSIFSKNTEMVQLILEKDSSIINKVDSKGQTPLCYALERNQREIAKLLIEKGADPTQEGRARFGNYEWGGVTSPIKLIFLNRYLSIWELIIEKNPAVCLQPLVLYTAIDCNQSLEIINFIIERGADVNQKDKQENTPLHIAVINKNLNAANLLLDRGAQIDAKDKNSQTPLHIAVINKNFKAASLLLDRGAQVDARDARGRTPLHFAAIKDSLDIVNLLLDRGAQIDARDENDKTPLMSAIYAAFSLTSSGMSLGERLKLVETLLERGAKVNNQSGEKVLGLICANARSMHDDDKEVVKESIKLLLHHGASITTKANKSAAKSGLNLESLAAEVRAEAQKDPSIKIGKALEVIENAAAAAAVSTTPKVAAKVFSPSPSDAAKAAVVLPQSSDPSDDPSDESQEVNSRDEVLMPFCEDNF
jgi:ankyrin repeat protein